LDDFREDGFHPGDQANRYWAELVNQQLPTRD